MVDMSSVDSIGREGGLGPVEAVVDQASDACVKVGDLVALALPHWEAHPKSFPSSGLPMDKKRSSEAPFGWIRVLSMVAVAPKILCITRSHDRR